MALVQDPDQSEPAKLLLLEGLERLETPLFTDLVSREGRSDKECLQPFLHAGNELVVSKIIHVVDVAEILLHSLFQGKFTRTFSAPVSCTSLLQVLVERLNLSSVRSHPDHQVFGLDGIEHLTILEVLRYWLR